MKYRKDITEFIFERLDKIGYNKSACKINQFKVYEQEGLLYMANRGDGDIVHHNKIECYTKYSLLWTEGGKILKPIIEKKFDVSFDSKYVVCTCGQHLHFSAYYGEYSLILKCNVCNNEFVAYSG